MRSERFDTPRPIRLDVRLGAGRVELETDHASETTVELEPLRDNEASHEAVETARVELLERSERPELVVDVRGRSRIFSRGAEVLVRVSCPAESSAEIRTGSADVEGRGLFASVDVESGSGDVQFSDVSRDARVSAASGDVQVRAIGGEASVNTASGDVQLAQIGGDGRVNTASGDVMIREAGGDLRVNTASGDVLVRKVRGSLTVNTASGDQQIGSVERGNVDLKSASGDLKIGIKQGSRLFVDARSRSGEVRSELEVSDAPPAGEDADEGPLVELRANTMSGDITVTRASHARDSSGPAEPTPGVA